MENQELLDNNLNLTNELSLTSSAKDFLLQTAKWAKFLSIIGFVFIGLIVIAALFIGTFMGKLNTVADTGMGSGQSIFLTIYFIVIGLITIYPVLRLFQFSQKAKLAVETNNTLALEESFKRIRSVFRFYGIMMIIVLSIYAIAIIFALVVGSSGIFNWYMISF